MTSAATAALSDEEKRDQATTQTGDERVPDATSAGATAPTDDSNHVPPPASSSASQEKPK